MDNERDNSINEEIKKEINEEKDINLATNTESAPEEGSQNDMPDGKLPNGTSFKTVLSSIYDYVEVFAVSIIAVILIFTFGVRLCRVDGNSMNDTLKNDELIIATNLFYEPNQGDIIVFHLVNDSYKQPLVKRVIATEGQTVEINMKAGYIKVDGVIYEDLHAYLPNGEYSVMKDFDTRYYSQTTGVFAATVPEGKVFVLGDNRNNSNDSRMRSVSFVDVDTILGKAIIRIAPFDFLE